MITVFLDRFVGKKVQISYRPCPSMHFRQLFLPNFIRPIYTRKPVRGKNQRVEREMVCIQIFLDSQLLSALSLFLPSIQSPAKHIPS